MLKRAALFVDCDFVRGYLGDEGKQMDYERLMHSDITPLVQRSPIAQFFPDGFGKHYGANAFLSRPLGSGGLTLENFVARISGFGWRVVNYRINKMADDKAMPAVMMSMYAGYLTDMPNDMRPLIIFITSDRAILPYIDATGRADIMLVGPDHWADDMLVKQTVAFVPMSQFCEALPHVISMRGRNVEEKIAEEFTVRQDGIGAQDEG